MDSQVETKSQLCMLYSYNKLNFKFIVVNDFQLINMTVSGILLKVLGTCVH